MRRTDTAAGAGAVDRQALPYRTAFEVTLDLAEATDRVREQLRSWLRGKDLDVDRFDARQPTIGRKAALLYVSTNAASGWQLREKRGTGVTWVSTVSVTRADSAHASWVSLDVRALSPTGNAPTPAPPRLVGLLLETLEAQDAEAVLTPRPRSVPAREVERLLDVVCSQRRRLPVLVAAPPTDMEFAQWQDTVGPVTRDLSGLASLYLLHPDAVATFNDGIGPTHRVGPGTIRTYLTDVDPALSEDAVRHRVLGRRRIEHEPNRARRALAALPRQLAANALPARAAQGLELTFGDFARDRSAPAVATADVESLRAKLKEANELLELAGKIDRQQQATISRLQDELLDVASELEVAQVELAKRDDMVRALRRRLKDATLYSEAYTPPDETTELPKSFADLLDRLEELAPYATFTGSAEPCLDLDEQQQSSTWAQTTWQALLALHDYARSKQRGEFSGDFKRWCESPPGDGRAISAGKIAQGESETVRNNRRLAAMRVFPVPACVSSDGVVTMRSHIRLGQSTSVAPRMYLYDDTAKSGAVYIGYIGRHLENTQTT